MKANEAEDVFKAIKTSKIRKSTSTNKKGNLTNKHSRTLIIWCEKAEGSAGRRGVREEGRVTRKREQEVEQEVEQDGDVVRGREDVRKVDHRRVKVSGEQACQEARLPVAVVNFLMHFHRN